MISSFFNKKALQAHTTSVWAFLRSLNEVTKSKNKIEFLGKFPRKKAGIMAFTTQTTFEYNNTFEHGSKGSKNMINYPAPVQLPPTSKDEPKTTNWVFASVKCRKPTPKPAPKPVEVEEIKKSPKKKAGKKKNKSNKKTVKVKEPVKPDEVKEPVKPDEVEEPKEVPKQETKEPESWVSKTNPEPSNPEDSEEEEEEDPEELLLRLVTQQVSLEKTETKKHAKIESPFIEEENGWDLVKPAPPKNRDHVRSQALDTLADQQKLREAKKYTKLCDSVTSGKPCRHGERCRFAHSIEQLTVSPCFFKEKCRHVKKVDGLIHNIDGKPCCKHIHPCETKEHFLQRTGVQLPTPPTPPTQPTPSTPSRRGLGRPPKNQKKRMIPSKVTEVDLKPQPIVMKPVEKEMRETLIQVPNAEMATQAMEMAIKSGIKNIRVEIVPTR